jgi:ribosomal protein L40E
MIYLSQEIMVLFRKKEYIKEEVIMALIKCPECGNEISEQAKMCPRCGYKKRRKKKKITASRIAIRIVEGALALLAIFLIIVKIYFTFRTEKVEISTAVKYSGEQAVSAVEDFLEGKLTDDETNTILRNLYKQTKASNDEDLYMNDKAVINDILYLNTDITDYKYDSSVKNKTKLVEDLEQLKEDIGE